VLVVLAVIESILHSPLGRTHAREIAEHLKGLLEQLARKEAENRYLIGWICYFLNANGIRVNFRGMSKITDPIIRTTFTSRFAAFKACPDFKLSQGVKAAAKRISMMAHLDVFRPQ
jgi:hypothetical protein